MSNDSWTCYTCSEAYSLTTDGPPKRDESIENNEGVPVVIHYQCANCARFAAYHYVDYMSFSEQIAFREDMDNEDE